MKKKYISDVVSRDYEEWKSGKVFIYAQTGMGKTTFIMKDAMPYWLKCGKKVLILVNRRSLLKQYIYEQALTYEHYEPDIHIKTYQEFARKIKEGEKRGLVNAFDEYDVVVLDEVHFFVSDADFNPSDTYIMWQAILHSFGQCMVFMSATPEELQPFMDEYKDLIEDYCHRTGSNRGNLKEFWEYELDPDYDYIEPVIIEDNESMINIIANSRKKSIIFIDDIKAGREMKDKIKSIVKNKSVVCWDADSLEKNQEADQIMKTLCIAHRLECDILITTSVLDNGVSIHDKDVENVAIFTTSKSSFLQMLGRVRTEDIGQLKLILVPQKPEYWERREKILEEYVKEINRLLKNKNYERDCSFLCEALLDDDRMLDLYKKIFVLVPDNEAFPIYHGEGPGMKVRTGYIGGKKLVINRLAVAKILQLLQTVRRMHALSRKDIKEPCYEQLSWIGKKPEMIAYKESTHLQDEKGKMVQRLFEVQDYSKKEFGEWKISIAKQFRGTCLKHLNIKSGSPVSEEDLGKILEEQGLKLEKTLNENRQHRYTICRQ